MPAPPTPDGPVGAVTFGPVAGSRQVTARRVLAVGRLIVIEGLAGQSYLSPWTVLTPEPDGTVSLPPDLTG